MIEDKNSFLVDYVRCDEDVAKVAILGVPDRPGIAARFFSSLAMAGVPVEMIIQSVMRGEVNDIAFLIRSSWLGEAIEVSRKMPVEIEAQGVTFDTEICRITLHGKGFSRSPELPSQVFAILAERSVNLEMIVATGESISCVVSSADAKEAKKALEEFFNVIEDSSSRNN